MYSLQQGRIKLQLVNFWQWKNASLKETYYFFQQALNQEDWHKARQIQHLISLQNWEKGSPDHLSGNLNFPETDEVGPLYNNLFVSNSEIAKQMAIEALDSLQKLRVIMPDVPELAYNEIVLRLNAWSEGAKERLDQKCFQEQLRFLEKLQFADDLLDRLRINFYILKAQYAYLDKDYKSRSAAIRSIRNLYGRLPLNVKDQLRLVRFLRAHQELDLAFEVLNSQISDEVDEDILFMYLHFVTTRSRKMQQRETRSWFKKAREMNPDRYCAFFKPKPQGGHSMQLLTIDWLKNEFCTYCE